jgi:CRISPR-associated protein Cmr5
MRTLGQKRAEYALDKIIEKAPKDEKNRKEFNSFVAGSTTMILQNGLIQVLAFWLSKSDGEKSKHYILFSIIKEWLNYKNKDINNNFLPGFTGSQDDDFIKKLCELDQKKYLAIQRETLSMLEWVKRYANANIGLKE